MSRAAANYPVNWAGVADDSNVAGGFFDKLGQTFTVNTFGPYDITSVDIPLTNAGGFITAGIVTVGIYAVDGSGFPTGAVLSSGTYDATGMGGGTPPKTISTISVNVPVSAASLTSGTTYVLIVSVNIDESEGIKWYGTNTAGYTGGKPIRHVIATDTWENDVLLGEYAFRVWATDGSTLPGKATVVSPTNAQEDISLNVSAMEWANGTPVADTYNLYFGTTSGNLTLVETGLTEVTYTVPDTPLDYITTYYWRIDTTNSSGTTTGDEWSFITRRFDPPMVVYWYSTTGVYYRLLVQSDGTLGDPPPTGTVDVDYTIVGQPNLLQTIKKLTACAQSAFWYSN